MGLERIRAWATLFAMAGLGDRPIEILNLGLLRANLCERLCRMCRQGVPEIAYTVGLLSVLDAMLARPMSELVKELPLPDDIKRAISQREGEYGRFLDHSVRMERNEWPHDTCAGISPADLAEAYAASAEAAFTAIELLADD
jgi:EAL and modified HD-GYP domain-containing signal transduction protein